MRRVILQAVGQVLLVIAAAVSAFLSIADAPKLTPYRDSEVPWQYLMVGAAGTAVCWSIIQQVKTQLRFDRSSSYAPVIQRLGHYWQEIQDCRDLLEEASKLVDAAVARADEKADAAIDRYTARADAADDAARAILDEVAEYVANQPLLGEGFRQRFLATRGHEARHYDYTIATCDRWCALLQEFIRELEFEQRP